MTIDYGCKTGKRRYTTSAELHAAIKGHEKNHKRERPYKCRFCHGWHLTSYLHEMRPKSRARSLHRLAEENARLLAANRDCVDHFEQMRGELAALKARIAEARRVMLGTYPAHGSGYVQIVSDPANGIGDETFALLKLEDGER